jgi:hypothetical protein
MRSQSTCAHNGRQADSQDSPSPLCALVQEEIDALRALLDRETHGLRHGHASDARRQLRLLLILQDAQERLARADRNRPRLFM